MENTQATYSWNDALLEQLDWHWREHLRPRLDGLTDDEYFWEPSPGSWNVRPRGQAAPCHDGAVALGGGGFAIDFAFPEPEPAPVTTIAWRIGHVVVGVLGTRNAGHFGAPPMDYGTHEYAATADAALAQLDAGYALWTAGVRDLGDAGLMDACGPAEGGWSQAPMADLVLHINREVIHHGAEVCLLRDLYAHRP